MISIGTIIAGNNITVKKTNTYTWSIIAQNDLITRGEFEIRINAKREVRSANTPEWRYNDGWCYLFIQGIKRTADNKFLDVMDHSEDTFVDIINRFNEYDITTEKFIKPIMSITESGEIEYVK